jgi:hypothetical protein
LLAGWQAVPGRPSGFRGPLAVSPEFLSESAIFLFADPALVSITTGFLASYLGTILSSESWERDTPYEEIYARSNVGFGEA